MMIIMRKIVFSKIGMSIGLVLFCLALQAQLNIKGTVVDVKNEPLTGVTVVVKGTTAGTVTDQNGSFSLNIPANARKEIVVSFIGFKSQTILIERSQQLKIVLEESAKEIDEVVVVGYGTMRKSDLTGSLSSVKIDETRAARSNSFDQLLQGRAAGILVTNTTGAPGSSINIKIRGTSSFNGGSEPLYVVDGVILNSPSQDNGKLISQGQSNNNSDQPTNGLMGISPHDIANIEILKDASATAIYGAMGANGVVLITTKTGNSDRPTVEWSSGLDISTPSKKIPLMNLDEYIQYARDTLTGTRFATTLGRIFLNPANPDSGMAVQPVDWQDYVIHTSISQHHRVSVSGRSNSSNYLVSANMDDVRGIVKNTQAKTTSFRLNYEKSVIPGLKIGVRNSFSQVLLKMTQGTDQTRMNNSTSLMKSVITSRPYYNFANQQAWFDGEVDVLDAELLASPVMWLNDFTDNTLEYRVTPSFYLEGKIAKWLTYKFNAGADYRNRERNKWKGPQIISDAERSVAAISNMNSLRYNIDNLLMFDNDFGKGHRLSGTAGVTFTHTQMRTQIEEGWTIFQYWPQTNSINAAPNTRFNYQESENAILSYLVRGVYSFRNKYVATATFRADGSSKFTRENRFSYFPSLAFAWRINEEKWLNLPSQVSNLKARMGWGMVGNEAISPYQTLSTFGSNLYPDHTPTNTKEGIVGISPSSLANKDLKWETTEQYNAGIDIGLFDNRISLTADIYDKYTKDLLQVINIPGTTGFSTMWVNQGKIRNKGLELTLESVLIKKNNFSWNIDGNFSLNRNKILKLGQASSVEGMPPLFYGDEIGSSNYLKAIVNIFMEGHPMGLFYGFKTDGLVQSGETGPGIIGSNTLMKPGGIKYVLKPENTSGYLSANDRFIIGDPNSKFNYGFSSSFNYKNVSLSLSFYGVFGADIVNANYLIETDVTRTVNIRKDAYFKAWTPQYTNTVFPAINVYNSGETAYFTDRIVEDGSFLRLSNVNLTYNVPAKKLKYVKNLSVSVSANNLFIWTNYNGYDPEVSSYGTNIMRMGVDNGSFPISRTFSFGINASF
jgi:TonB-dependent starch-binding outer membrane protein SusC